MYADDEAYLANWLKLCSGERSNVTLVEGGATVRESISQQLGDFAGDYKISFLTFTVQSVNIQGVPGGMCQISGECSLC